MQRPQDRHNAFAGQAESISACAALDRSQLPLARDSLHLVSYF